MELVLDRQESFISYIKRRLAGSGIRSPLTVCIDLTSSCNLSCSYCYARRQRGAEVLPMSTVERLIPDLVQLGTFEVIVSGGEPTLHPEFQHVVAMFKKAGFRLCVLTNGTQPDALLLVSKLLQREDYIQISLDALVDYPCRQGADAALRTINLLANTGIQLTVNTVANKHNSDLILPLVREVHRLGVRSFSLNFLYPFSKSDFDLCLTPDDQFRLNQQVFELCRILGLSYTMGLDDAITAINSRHMRDALTANLDTLPEVEPTSLKCDAGIFRCYISSRGEVFPCVFASDPRLMLGELGSASFTQIWLSSQRHAICSGRDLTKVKCGQCPFLRACRGGCPGVAMAIGGRLNDPDPRCRFEPGEHKI